MILKTITLLTLMTLSLPSVSQETLNLADLGQLNLKYSVIKQVDSLALRPINATVTSKTGEAFQLVAPFAPQSYKFLANNGEFVQAGKAIMLLSGSEVHHFIEQFEAAKSLFNLTKSRYDSNKKLFQQKSISNDKWLAISQNYYTSKIEYGHYRHFNELIHSIESEDDIIIKAPLDGYFIYPEPDNISTSESKLGQILPKSSLRLQAFVSKHEANKLKSFETNNCHIEVAQVSQISEGYFVKVWSMPVRDECQLSYGQAIPVIPHLATSAYQVPKSSVFNLDRSSYILIKQGKQIISTAINIMDSNDKFYFVDSDTDLHNQHVLSTSVAAIQGILMGLGGE